MANPSVVKFSGRTGDYVPVVEDVERVTEAFNASGGSPFALETVTGKRVYFNPARIACWYERDARHWPRWD